jgi:SAM-dependent methyltransferase
MFDKKKHVLGFIQAVPTPTSEELKRFYAEKYYQNATGSYEIVYGEDELSWFKNRAVVAEAVVRKYREQSSILDIGCGEGFLLDHFFSKGWQVLGWDFSKFGVEKFNPHLLPHFMQGDIYELIREHKKIGQQFSVVNLSNVLEHVIDPIFLLEEVRDLLAPDGLLRITVPQDFSAFQQLLMDKNLTTETWFAPPDHLNYFNRESFMAIIAHCRYECVELLADFPIEQFIANVNANYAKDKSLGKGAHLARITIENFLIDADLQAYINYASNAATLGFGRNLTAYVR